MLSKYEKNPILRGLIQLIPLGIGSGIDVALSVSLGNIRQERMRTFFDELGNCSIELSPDLLDSEDFLHCYFSTVKAAINTRRRDKIKMFARLLKSTIQFNSFSKTDEYEEYLQILDELSYRELMILIKLESFETQYVKKENENDLQKANRFWDQFRVELVEELEVQEDEIDAILTRLNRTGCYESFVGAYWSYTGGKGKTTPTFKSLMRHISEEYK